MIWLNGQWQGEAQVAVSDRGFTLGDGLFETMKTSQGRILRRERHETRLRASAQALGLPDPLAGVKLDDLAREMTERLEQDALILRFSVSAGEGVRGLVRPSEPCLTRCLTGAPAGDAPDHLTLALSNIRRSGSSLSARHKTLSYVDNLSARRQARLEGADMGLLLDTRGYLSGGDSANLFWFADGRWYTPALDCGVLAGTVRAELLEQVDIQEGRYAPSELLRADVVVMSNAAFGLVPVRKLGGHDLTEDTARLDQLKALLD
ncbi:MAG: 4-amino-4-deoxychorismate lyase [Alphaproteobacteria bacterium]|nr:4-amino-4-deoxychorismate lyase [Alphaproteobacteria bacterium]